MKKIIVLLFVILTFISCDDWNYQEKDDGFSIELQSSYSVLITGNSPMIKISTENDYYYGLQYGVDYQKSISKTTIAKSFDEYPVNASIRVEKMTDDSSTITVSIIYDGSVVDIDTSSDPYAIINLYYTYYVSLP